MENFLRDTVQRMRYGIVDVNIESERIRQGIADYQQDYRRRHAEALALELAAFDEWKKS